ncbi:hypothetical protein [Aestuariivirga sp.]|uniref:hypothetical protein n=1 Tax=Aestuariivirga sp. TaxID=2650926 RepID=UPI00391A867C
MTSLSGISTAGLLGALLLSSLQVPSWAAAKCEMHTKTCVDGRTGQARVCITTICRKDGEIVSIDTIVLLEGESSPPPKLKTPGISGLPKAPVR